MKVKILSVALVCSHLCLVSFARSLRAAQDNNGSEIRRNDKQKLRSKQSGANENGNISESEQQPSGDQDRKDSRIIGGSQTNTKEYPFAVSLQDNQGHFCGGSLITRNVVLTAAHCKGGNYNVVVGRHRLSQNGGQIIRKKIEVPHPQYNERTTNNDYMLVVLSSPVNLNSDTISLAKVNDNNSLPSVGSIVTAAGWGDTTASESTSRLSDVLMKVNVNVISNSKCEKSSDGRDNYRGQITDRMLCAKANSKDSCQGDSGGPLTMKKNGIVTQVGIVSWGIGCADSNFPGVYARVSKVYSWIESEVCRTSRQYAIEAGFNCSGSSAGSVSPRPPAPAPAPAPPAPKPKPKPTPINNNLWDDKIDDWVLDFPWWDDDWEYDDRF